MYGLFRAKSFHRRALSCKKRVQNILQKKVRSTASIDQKQNQSAKILTSAAQMGCNLFFMHTEMVDSPNIIRQQCPSPIIMQTTVHSFTTSIMLLQKGPLVLSKYFNTLPHTHKKSRKLSHELYSSLQDILSDSLASVILESLLEIYLLC